MSEAEDIELLFAIWEQNVETVRAVNRVLRQDQLPKSRIAPQLVAHLKRCAITLVKPTADVAPTVKAGPLPYSVAGPPAATYHLAAGGCDTPRARDL